MHGWRYEEVGAEGELARDIAAFWQFVSTPEARDDAGLRRVLPDGCVDLVIDLGGDGSGEIVGTMTRALSVPLGREMDLFGVRFRPGGTLRWLRVSLAELTDTSAAARDLELPVPNSVLDALVREQTLTGRARIVGTWLRARALELGRASLAGRGVGVASQAAVISAARLFLREGAAVSVAARHVNMSSRTLERAFRNAVGLTPAEYRRVARLRRALYSLGSAENSLAGVAARAGYYDQPHFDREFKRLVGCTPREWLLTRVAFVQDADISVL